jgi:SAM-dependent methyltransferase
VTTARSAKSSSEYFKEAGLQPGDDVLDAGCGIGRMALPLTGWLTGEYRGFDIVRSGVDWCQANVANRHPNFSFSWVDVHNEKYNPGGREHAESFRLPYDAGSFEFAFLTSVFTHMTPPGILNYLSELRRVLRPGGTLLATYFLLEEVSREGIAAGRSKFDFRQLYASAELGEFLTINSETVESAVEFDRRRIEGAHAEVGLPIREVRPGRWSGRTNGLSLQDITISTAG